MKRIFVAWLGLMALRGSVGQRRRSRRAISRSRPACTIRSTTGPASMSASMAAAAGVTPSGTGINKFDVSGGMIGGTIGYNWQVGQIVVGAEGDIDWSGVKGSTDVLCARRLRDAQQVARHRARPSRLRLRPVPALHHRWSCGRRHQRDQAGLPGRQRHQCRLDRRRWSRGRHRQQCEHQSRVPLRGSRRLQLRVQLRSRGQRQRVLTTPTSFAAVSTFGSDHRRDGARSSPGSPIRGFCCATARCVCRAYRNSAPAAWSRRRPARGAANSSSHATRRG